VNLSNVGRQKPPKTRVRVEQMQGKNIGAYQHDEQDKGERLLPLMDKPQ
jgi:hypothetical protein